MPRKAVLIVCGIYTLMACFIFTVSGNFPRIPKRDVQVQLNILRFKYNDEARSHIDDDKSLKYDMGGGCIWQNRILVPTILWLGKTGIEKIFPFLENRFLAARIFYLFLLIAILYFMFLTLFWYCEKLFGREKQPVLVATLVFNLLFYLIVLYSPRMKIASDYLSIIFLMIAVILSLERKLLFVILLAVLQSWTREISLFFGIIYYILNCNRRNFMEFKLIVRSFLICAIAFAVIVITRAFFLGGLKYAFGLGLPSGEYHTYGSIILTSLSSAWIRPATLASWFIIIMLLGISFYKIGKKTTILSDIRLIVLGIMVFIISILFGGLQEARILLPFVIILLLPFTHSLVAIFPGKITHV